MRNLFVINVDFSSTSPDPKMQGGRRKQASKTATSPLKSGYFTAIGSYSVKTAAYRYTHAAYHNKH